MIPQENALQMAFLIFWKLTSREWKGEQNVDIFCLHLEELLSIGFHYIHVQCCGSGSGIPCLFDPWTRIRDPE